MLYSAKVGDVAVAVSKDRPTTGAKAPKEPKEPKQRKQRKPKQKPMETIDEEVDQIVDEIMAEPEEPKPADEKVEAPPEPVVAVAEVPEPVVVVVSPPTPPPSEEPIAEEPKPKRRKKDPNPDDPPKWFKTFVANTKMSENQHKEKRKPSKQVKEEAAAQVNESWRDGYTRNRVQDQTNQHMQQMHSLYSQIFRR